jgi:membrane protease YdiL (CAAX protease family)
MTALQLLGRQGTQARQLFVSLSGWGWLGAGLLLMCVTAAATEEYFFRGVMLGGLAHSGVPSWVSAAIATVAFVVYHIPYAYTSPHWTSHGNLTAAVGTATANALLAGALFSAVYVASRRHLLAPWLAHALTNMVPGALYLQRQFAT